MYIIYYGACWHRPRGPGLMEPGLLAGDARCSPTSLWGALESPLILTRRGTCKRSSGGQGCGGGAIVGRALAAATGGSKHQPYTYMH